MGALKETFELVANEAGLVPVVTCGRNSALRDDLEELAREKGYRAHLLGWTDDMAGVMAASDVLVENAGGLTSLEAMGAGLPVVTFRPIPGHGRNSAAAMSAAGVSCLASTGDELVEDLGKLGRPGPARSVQLAASANLFSGDASAAVEAIATFGVPPEPRLRPVARVRPGCFGRGPRGRHILGRPNGRGWSSRSGRDWCRPPSRGDPERRLPWRAAELRGATEPFGPDGSGASGRQCGG